MPFMNIVLIVVERFLQHRMLGKFHDQQGDVELDMFPDKAAETLSIPHFLRATAGGCHTLCKPPDRIPLGSGGPTRNTGSQTHEFLKDHCFVQSSLSP